MLVQNLLEGQISAKAFYATLMNTAQYYCMNKDIDDLCDQLWKDMWGCTPNITSTNVFRAVVVGSIFHDATLTISFYRSDRDLDEMYIWVQATNYEYYVECSARMVWNLPMFEKLML